jgi:hypothetical protein
VILKLGQDGLHHIGDRHGGQKKINRDEGQFFYRNFSDPRDYFEVRGIIFDHAI